MITPGLVEMPLILSTSPSTLLDYYGIFPIDPSLWNSLGFLLVGPTISARCGSGCGLFRFLKLETIN